MKKPASKKIHLTVGKVITAASAVTALVAGAFLLSGERGQKNRTMMRGWAVQAKGEVMEELENLKEVTQDKYLEIVDVVLKRWQSTKKVGEKDLAKLGKELRSYWRDIADETSKTAKKVKKTAKR